jgi:hypothetical protein
MKGIITLHPAQEKYLNLLSREEEGAADTLEDYRFSYLINFTFVLLFATFSNGHT